MSHKFIIVYDRPGWAFERIAWEIAKHDDKNEYLLIPSGAPTSWSTFHNNLPHNFDLVHYMWRPAVLNLKSINAIKISTAVYDHLYSDNPKFTKEMLSDVPFYVSSKKLKTIYELDMFPETEIPVCQDGVDHLKFRPRDTLSSRSTLRVGWVGNSKWANTSQKGLNEILIPVINSLEKRGRKVELVVADAAKRKILHSEMPQFYDQIDVLICCSAHEGTPNPILEASSAGKAWISTDVGIVPELAGPLQSRYIVQRNVESFVEAISAIQDDQNMLGQLGSENRQVIESGWTWSQKAASISNYFNKIVKM